MKHTTAVPVTILTVAGWLLGCLPATLARPAPADSPAPGGTSKAEMRAVAKAQKQAPAESEAEARAWLGVAVEEASEALSEQLELGPGIGLVVLHVSPDSPAAKAGLKKNDVLAQLAGHALSHPAQLRRLVQARQPGDTVELVYYRGGKRQTVSVTLGKAPPSVQAEPKPAIGLELFKDWAWPDVLEDPSKWLGERWLRWSGDQSDKIRREIERSLDQARRALQDAARGISNAQPRVQTEIERSIEQARKAVEEALRQMSNVWQSLRGSSSPLKDLLRGGIRLDKNASVAVRTRADSAYSLVKSDDWGTVIVTGPPARLTARDKAGNLVFEGDIETPEQRAKVPPEVWERVAPLLDELPSTPEPSKSKPRPTRPTPKAGVAL